MQARPRAFSYMRFSTPEQARGDSRRRQLEAAERYAAKHGLELDDQLTLHDEGVSAFRGKNVRGGSGLKLFLDAITEGLIPEGSYLLVENLDRVSRASPWDAMFIFQQIINGGVTIVTLQDDRKWSKADILDSPVRMIESILVMMRANEESATKSRRLKAAWSNKRGKIAERRLTTKCPAWLTPNASNRFDTIPERVKVVRGMFRMAKGGAGQHAIANDLNRTLTPTFGGAVRWHRSYIAKVLNNPAVVGRFIPNEIVDGERRPLEAVEGYYPAIIDEKLFEEVHALMKGCKSRSGRNTAVRSVFAGLARCPRCGASVTRWTDGKRPYLVCTAKRAGVACTQPNLKYEPVERAMFAENGRSFELVPPPGTDGAMWDNSVGLDHAIDEKLDQAKSLAAIVRSSPATSALLVEELASLEAEIASDRTELERLRKQGRGLNADQWQLRIKRLSEACAEGDCERVNRALRLLVDKVEVEPEQITLHLLHGEIASLSVVENLFTD